MNRLYILGLILISFLLCTGFQIKDLRGQVIGAWRYDTKSLKLTLMPKAKKELEKQGQSGTERLEQMKQALRSQIGVMTLFFKQNGTFLVVAQGTNKQVQGKWTMVGRQILVVMDKRGQSVPVMNLEPNGKRIQTNYIQKDFATGTVNLVKVAG